MGPKHQGLSFLRTVHCFWVACRKASRLSHSFVEGRSLDCCPYGCPQSGCDARAAALVRQASGGTRKVGARQIVQQGAAASVGLCRGLEELILVFKGDDVLAELIGAASFDETSVR